VNKRVDVELLRVIHNILVLFNQFLDEQVEECCWQMLSSQEVVQYRNASARIVQIFPFKVGIL
jgi:hypothetical protein